MKEFFNLITTNWIGALIGIVAASVICLALGFTVFKSNKIAGSIISIIIIVVFAFAGIFIQDYFFSKRNPDSPFYDPTQDPSIDYIEPDTILTIKSNGGYDRSYIEKKLETAEKTEDKFFDIGMVEYKDIVIFSYENLINDKNCTVNIFMYKNQETLAFDGCINVKAKRKSGILWWATYSFTNEMFRGNNFTPLKRPLNSTNSLNAYSSVFNFYYTNFVFGSDALTYACSGGTARKTAQVGCLNVYNNYFQQLGDLGLILEKDNICKQMNNFYSSIFNAVKNTQLSNPAVNVTNRCAYYNNTNKKFYKCNLYLNVQYKNYSKISAIAGGTSKNNNVEEKVKKQVDKEVSNFVTVPYIKFILSPEKAYDMSDFNIAETPVKIKLIGEQNYEINFDTKTKLALGILKPIAIGHYAMKIESDCLAIGNIADLEIKKSSEIVKLTYDYQYNTILTSVRLNPLSNFDFSKLDIINNPVIITFNNGTSSYNFEFNTLESLNQTIAKRLPFGSYNWAINSTELAFKEKNGTIEINVNNHEFIFNYDYKTNIEYKITASTDKYHNTEDSFIRFNLTTGFYDKTFKVKSATLFIIYFEGTKESEIKSCSGFRINDTGSLILQDNPFSFDVEKSDLKDNEYNSFQIQLKLEDDSIIQTNMTNFKLKFNNGLLNDPYLFSVVFTLTREQ